MGGTAPSKQKFVYSIPCSEAKEGETAIRRAPMAKDGIFKIPKSGWTTAQELFLLQAKESADLQFLGRRLKLPDGTLEKKYTWETYSEAVAVAQQIGSGIINLGLTEEKAQFEDYKIKFVSIYSTNTREWVLVDTANMLYGFTTMPIYDTLGEEACGHMLNETELTTIFLTVNHIKNLMKGVKSGEFKFLKNFVIMDEDKWNDELKAECEGINVYTLTEVINAGKENIQPYPEVKPKDIAMFSYTSGTTGKPKGAMISHKNIAAAVAGAHEILPFEVGDQTTTISYLPLAHVLERIVQLTFVHASGRYGIFGGDVRKITDDLAILKPDVFVSVPRLYNKFYDKIHDRMRNTKGVKGFLAKKALQSKEKNFEKGGYYTHKLWDKLVFSKMQNLLGGNVKFMLSGSAPISSEVRKFMKLCFACPFSEGYGQTEGLGGQFLTNQDDPEMGHVGGPLPHVEFKLRDVPEMNYFATDKDENGNPTPRGEILSRSDCLIPGFYKNKAKTEETFDSEGFLCSGDIGMILPNGALKIIDRRKNIFKLSIGEYIAPDKLQEVYKTCRGVSDIFVYGDSLKSVIVAVICSEEEDLRPIANELGIEGTHDELTQNEEINKWFLDQLLAKQKEAGLKGFERIKKLYISPKNFEELQLLTTTFKIKRHLAKVHFKEILDNLYEGLY